MLNTFVTCGGDVRAWRLANQPEVASRVELLVWQKADSYVYGSATPGLTGKHIAESDERSDEGLCRVLRCSGRVSLCYFGAGKRAWGGECLVRNFQHTLKRTLRTWLRRTFRILTKNKNRCGLQLLVISSDLRA